MTQNCYRFFLLILIKIIIIYEETKDFFNLFIVQRSVKDQQFMGYFTFINIPLFF